MATPEWDEYLDEKACTIRAIRKPVRDASAKILDEATFADRLNQEHRRTQNSGGLDFNI